MKRALALVIGLAVVASACSGSDGGDTTTTAVATTAVESSTTSTAGPASTTSSAPTTTAVATTTTSKVPPTTASGVFLATDLVWEGQTQTITLYDDGLLVAGSAQGQADFSPEEYEWITPSATLEVIELGASQHPEALLLT
ncbi:MAG: hypothetical protein GY720_15340, partial [bacterium]|nr:hypothetical protein [bacterium]